MLKTSTFMKIDKLSSGEKQKILQENFSSLLCADLISTWGGLDDRLPVVATHNTLILTIKSAFFEKFLSGKK